MKTISVSAARATLYNLIDETAETHIPIIISGKRQDAILISTEDWASIQETLHLLSVPGMVGSIQEGIDTPLEECDTKLRW